MPAPVNIGGNGILWVGTDKKLSLKITDAAGVVINVAGMTFLFVVRSSVMAEEVKISMAGAIVGTGDAQRIEVNLSDTDTSAAVFSAKTYKYSLKRMDDGSEDIYAHGDFIMERATQV